GDVDRRAGEERAARWIGEELRAERPGLRPVFAPDQPLENQHVLVLVVEHDALELPVEQVVRGIERGRVTLRADRTRGHQPAILDPADAGILDAIALVGALRSD